MGGEDTIPPPGERVWRSKPSHYIVAELIPCSSVAGGFLDPWTTFLRFDESSTMRTHRYSDRFSAVRAPR
jgi:hypothetical protein